MAFLDKHPISSGHTLVIPKEHNPDFYELSKESYIQLWESIRDLSGVLKGTFQPHRVSIIVAGYDVPHAHVHIVPMHHYDDITSRAYVDGKRPSSTPEELREVAQKIGKNTKFL